MGVGGGVWGEGWGALRWKLCLGRDGGRAPQQGESSGEGSWVPGRQAANRAALPGRHTTRWSGRHVAAAAPPERRGCGAGCRTARAPCRAAPGGGGGGGGQACQVLAQLMRGQGARASTLSPLSTRLGRMPGLFFGQAWECITNSSSTEKTTPTGPPSPRPNPGQEPVAIYSPQPPPVLTRLRRSKK